MATEPNEICLDFAAPQAHMSRSALPISDYVTDTKGALDNSLRILQVRSTAGCFFTCIDARVYGPVHMCVFCEPRLSCGSATCLVS